MNGRQIKAICCGIVLVIIAGVLYSCGDDDDSSSETGTGSQEPVGREIVVTRDNESYGSPCQPEEVGRYLERLTDAFRKRDGEVLREAWGEGFRAMSFGDEDAPHPVNISSYSEGMRKLRGHTLNLRADVVMVGQGGAEVLFAGKRFDHGKPTPFFGRGLLRCRDPIGIRMLGIVSADADPSKGMDATLAMVKCPAPEELPGRAWDAIVVCARGDGER